MAKKITGYVKLQVPAGAIEGGPTTAAVDLHGAVGRIPGGAGGEQLGLGRQ